MEKSSDIITTSEAAALLGVTRGRVDQIYRSGLLEAAISPGRLRFTRASVETYKAHRDARGKAGRYDDGNAPPRYDN
jgi:excisionase family DNA binding protein